MPELPDVEVTRRDLKRWLVGAIVSAAVTGDARLSRPASPRAFARALAGRTVERIERRGKWLRIDLDDGGKVFSHLGMTGEWVRAASNAGALRFERARIDVERRGRPSSVRYVDARRFGRLLAARDDIAEWTTLGPDPLADGIDVGRFSAALAKGRRAVKEIVMDQRVFAGVGNILATEVGGARASIRALRGDPRPSRRRARDRPRHPDRDRARARRPQAVRGHPPRRFPRVWPRGPALSPVRDVPVERRPGRPDLGFLPGVSGAPRGDGVNRERRADRP